GDRRGGGRGAAGDGAGLVPQAVVDTVDGAVGAPAQVVVVHRLPGWEVGGQGPPDPAVAGDVADRVDEVAAGMPGRSATAAAGSPGRDQRRDQRPFRVGHVRRVPPYAAAG